MIVSHRKEGKHGNVDFANLSTELQSAVHSSFQ